MSVSNAHRIVYCQSTSLFLQNTIPSFSFSTLPRYKFSGLPSGSRRAVSPSLSSATVKAFCRFWMALDLCSLSYWIRSGLQHHHITVTCVHACVNEYVHASMPTGVCVHVYNKHHRTVKPLRFQPAMSYYQTTNNHLLSSQHPSCQLARKERKKKTTHEWRSVRGITVTFRAYKIFGKTESKFVNTKHRSGFVKTAYITTTRTCHKNKVAIIRHKKDNMGRVFDL